MSILIDREKKVNYFMHGRLVTEFILTCLIKFQKIRASSINMFFCNPLQGLNLNIGWEKHTENINIDGVVCKEGQLCKPRKSHAEFMK